MDIKDFLSPADALVDLRAPDKLWLLQDLSMRAAASLKLDAELVSKAILAREELGSTGMGGGVAIPHARIPGLKKPFGILACLKKSIGFDAIDTRAVDVVFFLLLPSDARASLTFLTSRARGVHTSVRPGRGRAHEGVTTAL
jgi:nitrogen PTS system EIIA component